MSPSTDKEKMEKKDSTITKLIELCDKKDKCIAELTGEKFSDRNHTALQSRITELKAAHKELLTMVQNRDTHVSKLWNENVQLKDEVKRLRSFLNEFWNGWQESLLDAYEGRTTRREPYTPKDEPSGDGKGSEECQTCSGTGQIAYPNKISKCFDCDGSGKKSTSSAPETPDDLLEKLAALEHDQWIEWSKNIAETEMISPSRLARWKKMWIPYSQLSEDIKEHDRTWARKVLILNQETNR